MLRVVENPKSQSRPEFFDNSAKLDLFKKEGNPINNDFEPLVIARMSLIVRNLVKQGFWQYANLANTLLGVIWGEFLRMPLTHIVTLESFLRKVSV